MTVVDDRIEMADSLDLLFEQVEPVPEGYHVEIVGGTIHMSPQRDAHWQIIRRIVRALEDAFGMEVKVTSDVRIDFPGHLNGFAPDVAKLRSGAAKDARGRWRYQDVELIAEVISEGTAANDYGPKKAAYAAAEVPVYLIADPYTGACHVFTYPKDDEYHGTVTLDFGYPIDLTGTVVGLTLETGDFPRD
ncbi:Uma2 family endonuclease [Streptomyces sp. NBC_01180]|uniref:Uma2 family endonuclease n=1 Tax=Streptomyces sp. NBC_01180 TaxID=2903763 RepID=UPI00386F2869|nr:Uma2 family endonuclease [Streptomyces sp. NBC_01180]